VASNQLLPSLEFLLRHPEAMAWFLGLSVASCVVQLCISHTIKQYGALVFATIMTTRQFFSILLSSVVFSKPFTLGQWWAAASSLRVLPRAVLMLLTVLPPVLLPVCCEHTLRAVPAAGVRRRRGMSRPAATGPGLLGCSTLKHPHHPYHPRHHHPFRAGLSVVFTALYYQAFSKQRAKPPRPPGHEALLAKAHSLVAAELEVQQPLLPAVRVAEHGPTAPSKRYSVASCASDDVCVVITEAGTPGSLAKADSPAAAVVVMSPGRGQLGHRLL
jgi:hypothetical protein